MSESGGVLPIDLNMDTTMNKKEIEKCLHEEVQDIIDGAGKAFDFILEETDDIVYWTWQDTPGECKENLANIIKFARKKFLREEVAKATARAVHRCGVFMQVPVVPIDEYEYDDETPSDEEDDVLSRQY